MRTHERERECPNCGDPLPLDGRCDCQGDPDRDYQTAHRGLGVHEMPVRATRLGHRTGGRGFDSIVEGFGGEVPVKDLWV